MVYILLRIFVGHLSSVGFVTAFPNPVSGDSRDIRLCLLMSFGRLIPGFEGVY